jgi:hypothetical protein
MVKFNLRNPAIQTAQRVMRNCRSIGRTRGEAYLRQFTRDVKDLRLFYTRSFPAKHCTKRHSAIIAPIELDGICIGVHAIRLDRRGRLYGYDWHRLGNMGVMTLRLGKPNKIIIGEQIEHVIAIASDYPRDYTLIATGTAAGLATYLPARLNGNDVIIVPVNDVASQAAAASLLSYVTAHGTPNRVRIVERMEYTP